MRKIGSVKHHEMGTKVRETTRLLTVVDERCNDLCLGPFCPRVEFFRVFVPTTLICNCDFFEIVIQDGLVKAHDELACYQ